MVLNRKKRVTYFGNFETLKKVHGFRRFYISPWILYIKIIIISLIFLTATESIVVKKHQIAKDTGFMLVMDSSPSMSMPDYSPTRLSAAKEITHQWIDLIGNNTLIGFLSYSNFIKSSVAPSHDHEAVTSELDKVEVSMSEVGASSINTAIDQSISYLMEATDGPDNETVKEKVIILLTDGLDQLSNDTLARAITNDVRIHTIGIGDTSKTSLLFENLSMEGVDEELAKHFKSDFVSSLEMNFTYLEEVADMTGGKAYLISSKEGIMKAMSQASLEEIYIQLNTHYYVLLLVILMSILELVAYSQLGAI
ncbi:VWA domain-containing protein [Candidatus Woesearchaeota archaeon]|nr:VWA domain-containing protein [Candidatus Woesearchaeota archaeon]